MSKRSVKLLPVWIAVSAVVIAAGIILFALLGFNFSADRPQSKTFEVKYDTVLVINEKEEDLQKLCEDEFRAQGVSYSAKATVEDVNLSNMVATGDMILRYTFNGDVSSDLLQAAKTKIVSALGGEGYADADTSVSVHSLEKEKFFEADWRGAVAVATGVVVALIYVAVRFGVGSALTGLVACVHDVLATLALIVICRIPVYAYAPLLFGSIAAFLSVILWIVQCMKMRENFKDPSFRTLTAAEAVEESGKTARNTVLGISVSLALLFAVLGGVATAGVRLVLLPALIPVAVSTYSSLVFAPAVHAPIKEKFDRLAAKRKRYDYGKKKAEKSAPNSAVREDQD